MTSIRLRLLSALLCRDLSPMTSILALGFGPLPISHPKDPVEAFERMMGKPWKEVQSELEAYVRTLD